MLNANDTQHADTVVLPDLSLWCRDDLDRLVDLAERAVARPSDLETWRDLARAAHDLKGLASTYGYPVFSRVCGRLEALAGANRTDRPFAILVRIHALACLACVSEGYTGEAGRPLLSALLVGLENARLAIEIRENTGT